MSALRAYTERQLLYEVLLLVSLLQWLPHTWKFQWIYLIYRWVISIFFLVWLFQAGFYPINGGVKFFIFLTNWAFLVFNAYLFWGAISVTLSYILANFACKNKYSDLSSKNYDDEEDEEDQCGCQLFHRPVGCCGRERDGTTWHQKIMWVLFNIGISWAVSVTVLYWALLRTGPIDGVNITTHLVNALVGVFDIGVTGVPVRLLHIVYPTAAAGAYAVFTGIYFAANGTNTLDRPYIYSVIDYGSSPGLSAGLVLAVVLVFFPVIYLLTYGIFLLREGILHLVKRACCKNKEEHQPAMEMK